MAYAQTAIGKGWTWRPGSHGKCAGVLADIKAPLPSVAVLNVSRRERMVLGIGAICASETYATTYGQSLMALQADACRAEKKTRPRDAASDIRRFCYAKSQSLAFSRGTA